LVAQPIFSDFNSKYTDNPDEARLSLDFFLIFGYNNIRY